MLYYWRVYVKKIGIAVYFLPRHAGMKLMSYCGVCGKKYFTARFDYEIIPTCVVSVLKSITTKY